MTGINALGSRASYPRQMGAAKNSSASGFAETLKAQSMDEFIKNLSTKFGASVGVQSIGKSHKEIVSYVMSSGCREITLAPNIVERMQSDPDYNRSIESKISEYMDQKDATYAALKAMNRDGATGMIVHADGSMSIWIYSDDTPEEKARIRKAQAAKEEDKAERRAHYLALSQEAAQARRVQVAESAAALTSGILAGGAMGE